MTDSDSDAALAIDALLLVMAVECWDDEEEKEAEEIALARPQLDGALDAAVALGLIGPKRAAQIFEVATDEDESPLGGLPTDRLEAVDDLIADLVTAAEAPEADYRPVARLEGAVETLVDLGAAEADDRDRWTGLLREVEDALEDEFDEDESPPRRGRLLALRKVIPGPWTQNSARVTSVECYDDGVLMRWEETRELPSVVRHLSREEGRKYLQRLGDEFGNVVVADDRGTTYTSGGGGATWNRRGDHVVASGEARFSTAVPPEADVLWVRLGTEWIYIDVPADEGEAV